MTKNKFVAVLAAMSFAAVSSAALAFGLPAVPGTAAAGGVSSDQIVQKYVAGQKNVMNADSNMLAALGLKEKSEAAALQAKNLTEGATSQALEDAAKIQTENSKAIEAKMTGEKIVMDAASKKQFAQGMMELASGIANYIGMSADVKGFKPGLTSLGSANSAIFIAKSLPTSISSLGSTLKSAMTFAKANDIAIPKEATDATALL